MAKADYSPEAWERKKEYARRKSREKYANDPNFVKQENKKYTQSEKGSVTRRKYQKEYMAIRRQELYDWLNELKSSLGCEHCSFKDFRVLDFHHNESENKEYAISRMVSLNMSRDTILKEIAKCTVLCANCHRIYHYNKKRRL